MVLETLYPNKDAIRRTGDAYVLYPGSEDKQLRGFYEILPGLGAFAIRPSQNNDETDGLKQL